ncbi:MAG: hypothetical protein ACJ72E_00455 [Marmoricola sp.]
MNSFVIALHGFVAMVDPTPADRDVKAGWGAFGVFICLCLAVALLSWSLVRHLKKAKLNAEAGAFGDEPDSDS